MEIKTVFKTMMVAAVCLGSTILASCSDDDNDGIKLSASKVELGVDSTQTIAAANCTTPLTVKSSDEATATATTEKATITIKGVKAGATTILVTDANKQTANISVTVKEMLAFDKTNVSVAADKTESVTIKSGTAPYTIAVKDATIATATVENTTITIKGVKAGTTTITVTDSKKVTGIINITVSK